VTDLGLTICITHTSPARTVNDLDRSLPPQTWSCPTWPSAVCRVLSQSGRGRFQAVSRSQPRPIGERLVADGLDLQLSQPFLRVVRLPETAPGLRGKRTGLDVIFDESDPRYLKAEPDTYWIQHGGGDPAA